MSLSWYTFRSNQKFPARLVNRLTAAIKIRYSLQLRSCGQNAVLMGEKAWPPEFTAASQSVERVYTGPMLTSNRVIDDHVVCCETVVSGLVFTMRCCEDGFYFAPGGRLVSPFDSADDVTLGKLRNLDKTFDLLLNSHLARYTINVDLNAQNTDMSNSVIQTEKHQDAKQPQMLHFVSCK